MRRLCSSVSVIAEPPISDADLGVRIGFAISDRTAFPQCPPPQINAGTKGVIQPFVPAFRVGLFGSKPYSHV